MLLKIGGTGNVASIKKLQTFLGASVVNGYFDAATLELVRKWQSAHGLPADGIVGNQTWDAMFPTTFDIDSCIAKLQGAVPESVYSALPAVCRRFGIDTKLELAHFLAQCAEESQEFTDTVENLNYSEKGLANIFGKYFKPYEIPLYAHQPEKIANRVYANRYGNGPEASGDGWKNRGRGYIQLTFAGNYREFDEYVEDDVMANPDLVATKYPLDSAAFFFTKNNIWKQCNAGSSNQCVANVTSHVNVGQLGLPKRINYFNEFYNRMK